MGDGRGDGQCIARIGSRYGQEGGGVVSITNQFALNKLGKKACSFKVSSVNSASRLTINVKWSITMAFTIGQTLFWRHLFFQKHVSSCWCRNKVNITATPLHFLLLVLLCICSMKKCLWKNRWRLKSVCLIVKAAIMMPFPHVQHSVGCHHAWHSVGGHPRPTSVCLLKQLL
jgi:hypothetical protein